MDRAPAHAHPDLRGGERLVLDLAGGGAVDRVRGDCAERVDREVDDAASDLLVGVERDLHRAVLQLGMRDEVGDGGHDLRDPRLVVRAEQRRAVGRDQLVADVAGELGRLARPDRLARVAERDVAAVVADPPGRDVRAAHLARGVDVREERDGGHVVRRRWTGASR